MVVALVQVAKRIEGAREYVGILIDGAVADGRLWIGCQFQVLVGAVAEEVDLQVEGPGLHILVEIGQVGVVDHRFEGCAPAEALADAFGQGGFTGSNIAGHQDQTFSHLTSPLVEL